MQIVFGWLLLQRAELNTTLSLHSPLSMALYGLAACLWQLRLSTTGSPIVFRKAGRVGGGGTGGGGGGRGKNPRVFAFVCVFFCIWGCVFFAFFLRPPTAPPPPRPQAHPRRPTTPEDLFQGPPPHPPPSPAQGSRSQLADPLPQPSRIFEHRLQNPF